MGDGIYLPKTGKRPAQNAISAPALVESERIFMIRRSPQAKEPQYCIKNRELILRSTNALTMTDGTYQKAKIKTFYPSVTDPRIAGAFAPVAQWQCAG